MEADLDLADVNAELAKRHGRGIPYKHLWEACVEQRARGAASGARGASGGGTSTAWPRPSA